MKQSDYSFATKFRDVIRLICAGQINKMRPPPVSATVVSLLSEHTAMVTFAGDTNPVPISLGVLLPEVGAVVLVDGVPGARFVTDVLSGNFTIGNTLATPVGGFGEPGPPGPAGLPGADGATGPTGPTGAAGTANAPHSYNNGLGIQMWARPRPDGTTLYGLGCSDFATHGVGVTAATFPTIPANDLEDTNRLIIGQTGTANGCTSLILPGTAPFGQANSRTTSVSGTTGGRGGYFASFLIGLTGLAGTFPSDARWFVGMSNDTTYGTLGSTDTTEPSTRTQSFGVYKDSGGVPRFVGTDTFGGQTTNVWTTTGGNAKYNIDQILEITCVVPPNGSTCSVTIRSFDSGVASGNTTFGGFPQTTASGMYKPVFYVNSGPSGGPAYMAVLNFYGEIQTFVV